METWCGPGEISPYSFVVRMLCDSVIMFSWACEHEESNLFVSVLDQSLAQGRFQLEAFGLVSLVTFAGHHWGFRYLRFLLAFFLISNLDHRPEYSKCLVAFVLHPMFGFSSAHSSIALRWDVFDMLHHSPDPICPGLALTCFFVSLTWTHTCPSGGFLLNNSNLVTPIHGSDSDLSASMFQ